VHKQLRDLNAALDEDVARVADARRRERGFRGRERPGGRERDVRRARRDGCAARRGRRAQDEVDLYRDGRVFQPLAHRE
jgi:hypothetical protein